MSTQTPTPPENGDSFPPLPPDDPNADQTDREPSIDPPPIEPPIGDPIEDPSGGETPPQRVAPGT